MLLLSAVYESARINIALSLFPERDDVTSWDALDDDVRSELKNLAEKIQSAAGSGEQSLANYRRVIGEFNRGVREGFFNAKGNTAGDVTVTRGPYRWGLEIGHRANRGGDVNPGKVKQFVRATHLLAHEFGQLDQARSDAYGFIMRNVGPQRRDELGELAFSLPVLINYHRPLVQQILDDPQFSMNAFDAGQPPAPGHLEYLMHGAAALFHADPESWVRVAANMALAATPFTDGATLEGEHFQAPQQAAAAVFRAPIAAHTAVRRQVERVLLAREFARTGTHGIEMDGEREHAVTLWNVYQGTPAAGTRNEGSHIGHLVASNVIYLVSRYFDTVIPPDQTGFQFLRRHLAAFTCGFDSRVEGSVDPRALATAARGRATSEGLRRFEDGGRYIAEVSSDLQELAAALTKLHHVLDRPVEFVLEQLEMNRDTPLAGDLLALFRKYANLPRDLFSVNADFELFSKTHVKTRSIFDLLRSALYHVLRAVHPGLQSRGEASLLLDGSRAALERILVVHRQEQVRKNDAARSSWSSARKGPNLSGASSPGPGAQHEEDLVATAQMLLAEFDTLVRLMRALVSQVHIARVLGKSRSVLHHGGGRAAVGASGRKT